MSFQRDHVSRHIVHVLVGVDAEQLAMPFERIRELDFRHVPVAAEAANRSVLLQQRHDEIVDPQQASFDLLTGRRRDGDRDRRPWWQAATAAATTSRASARDPQVLQQLRIGDSRRDALQIAGRRVARSCSWRRRTPGRLSRRRRGCLAAALPATGGAPCPRDAPVRLWMNSRSP